MVIFRVIFGETICSMSREGTIAKNLSPHELFPVVFSFILNSTGKLFHGYWIIFDKEGTEVLIFTYF